MDRHRNERFDDRFGDGGGRRPPSRWSSGSPTERQPRYTRSGTGSGGEGFAGGNSGAGGRYHPYRAMQDLPPPPAAAGFPGGDPGGFGPAPPVSGPRRGFSARGGSPGIRPFGKSKAARNNHCLSSIVGRKQWVPMRIWKIMDLSTLMTSLRSRMLILRISTTIPKNFLNFD
ncbi:uncharacterized protein LOC141814021 isoform X3 [Curcuma longa]|uniref:uncharacterized protein LOC141814021 isoform X3 n=1 Tax=Curcuma longa TaxID=136217 RepID=UPI003D9E082D